MVYPGRPSTGCQTCRSRRIKCDEARPHCRACVRSGRECPGYPHPLDVVLRPQRAFDRKSGNAATTGTGTGTGAMVHSPRQADVNSGSESTSTPESSGSELSPLPWISPSAEYLMAPQVPNGLYLPMEDTVTAVFFNSYMYTPRDPLVRSGSMEHLPQLYAAAPVDSHLRMSSLAVAYFCVAAWMHQEDLLKLAQQCFGKALARTRQALQGDIEQSYDEILMTLMLLYFFEEFISIKENKPSPKHHLKGAIALINSCSPERRNSPLSDTLTNAIQGEIIYTAIHSPSPLVRTPENWPIAPGKPELASSRLMTISTALAKLRDRWMDFSTCTEMTDLEEVEGILSQARDIDQQFIAWTRSLPKHWDSVPAAYFPQSVREAGSFEGRCDCYSDLWVAETWNHYRTFRLTIQNIITNCLLLLPGREVEIEATATTIRQLATDICASVPFYLGSQTGSMQITDKRVEYPSADANQTPLKTAPLVGGWFIRPSLESLCALESLPEDILVWARGQLRRIHLVYTSGLMHHQL